MIRHSLDNMKFPPGRKRGVLKERTRGPKARRYDDRCDSIRDQVEIIPRKYWPEMAANKWHQRRRRQFRWTFDQGSIGSCAAESAYAGKGACDMRQGQPMVFTNPLFAYQDTSGGRDNGSVIGDNVEHMQIHGCCPEEVWPRHKGFREEPSAEAKRIAAFFKLGPVFYGETVDEFVSALGEGYNAHAGYSGHAVMFLRYLGRMLAEFKNSWGDWGDNGFGSLPLKKLYILYGMYFFKLSVPYATPGAGEDEWDWKSPWKPKHDQATLAHAVRLYNETTMKMAAAKSSKWVNSNAQWREDTYMRVLASCGLAV